MPTGYEDTQRYVRVRATRNGIGQALHEMRDGLTVILAYAQLLQRRIGPEQPVERDALMDRLAIIEDAANRVECRLRQLDRHYVGDR